MHSLAMGERQAVWRPAVDSKCFTGRPEVVSIEAHVVVTWHRGFSFTPFWNGVPMEHSKENVGTRVQRLRQ